MKGNGILLGIFLYNTNKTWFSKVKSKVIRFFYKKRGVNKKLDEKNKFIIYNKNLKKPKGTTLIFIWKMN